MPKDLEQASKFLRLNENSGKPPHTKMYKDHLGIPTISTGFNLNRTDAKQWIEAVGANFEAILAGTVELTLMQALQIEERIISEAERILQSKLGKRVYQALNASQQTALISLCVNAPALIGPNLTRYVKTSQWKSAEDEIRRGSNRDNHPGLQNRREREADMFVNELSLEAVVVLKREIAALEQRLARQRAKLSEKDRARAELASSVRGLTQNKETARSEALRLQDEYSAIGDPILKIYDEKKALLTEGEQLQNRQKSMITRTKAKEDSINELIRQYNNSNDDNERARLKSRIARGRQEVTDMIEQLKGIDKRFDDVIVRVKQINVILKRDLPAFKAANVRFEAAAEKFDAISASLDEAQANLSRAQKAVDALQNAIKFLEVELKEKKGQLSELKSRSRASHSLESVSSLRSLSLFTGPQLRDHAESSLHITIPRAKL